MARYKIECCLNCGNRSPGCHSTCEEYKTQRAELDETSAEKRKQHEIESGVKGILIDAMERNNKRTHYRKHNRKGGF